MSDIKEYTLDDVIKEMKKHNRRVDTKLISRAYEFAKSQHEGQLRKSLPSEDELKRELRLDSFHKLDE